MAKINDKNKQRAAMKQNRKLFQNCALTALVLFLGSEAAFSTAQLALKQRGIIVEDKETAQKLVKQPELIQEYKEALQHGNISPKEFVREKEQNPHLLPHEIVLGRAAHGNVDAALGALGIRPGTADQRVAADYLIHDIGVDPFTRDELDSTVYMQTTRMVGNPTVPEVKAAAYLFHLGNRVFLRADLDATAHLMTNDLGRGGLLLAYNLSRKDSIILRRASSKWLSKLLF